MAGPVVDTQSNFSVAAWVKIDRLSGACTTAVGQDGDRNSTFFLQTLENRFSFSTLGGRASATEPIQAGRW